VKPKVVVVGAGVSGLTVAYELAERSHRFASPVEVICLESSEQSGGNIRSEREGEFLCEWGPNGFLDNAPCTLTLVRRLGLEERIVRAQPTSSSRFVFRSGKLRRVPTGPAAFLLSDILSPLGKLRLGLEPIVPRRRADGEESVFAFARRRIGGEAARVLVDAMVSGVYGGDARQLSLGATFPSMRAMEREHGSLFRAMLAKRGAGGGGGPAGPGGTLTSFRNGMQELVDALTREVGDRLRYRVGVRSVSDMGVRGFRVHLDEGAPMDVDAVVLACPAWSAAPILEEMDPEMSKAVAEIPPAPLVVVQSGYRKAALGDFPEGFGFLAPRKQGARILGTIWSSNVFPGRAPEGSILFTTMLGGAHDPQAIDLDDREVSAAVRQDFTRIMEIATQPHFSKVIRHPRGIPQYTVGHLDRLERLASGVARHPGLWVAGNSYHGISVNACVEEAPQIAEAALEFLADRSDAATG
jgi:oxygen-dependent protoporphyrinogen oxidase